MTKNCIGCHLDLPLESFHVSKPNLYGRASRCKDCYNLYKREYAKKHYRDEFIITPDVVKRFWSLVNKCGPANPSLGECWVWIGSSHGDGYGHFRVGHKVLKAHRFSYEISVIKPGDEQIIRHKCDNPPCVRPDHLEIGLPIDNVSDMVLRKRRADFSGQNNGMSKLSNLQREQIRDLYKSGVGPKAIAKQFGLGRTTVYRVINQT